MVAATLRHIDPRKREQGHSSVVELAWSLWMGKKGVLKAGEAWLL